MPMHDSRPMVRGLECFIKVPRLYIYRDGTICNAGSGK